MNSLNLQLSKREICLMLAGLMIAEDAPDAYRLGLKALRQPDAKDSEVMALAEKVLKQLDPDGTI